jgi:hypothetical protein
MNEFNRTESIETTGKAGLRTNVVETIKRMMKKAVPRTA